MTYETVSLQTLDGVATLTLNRPDALNAISRQMWDELHQALAEVEQDTDTRALVLTGAGRAFCAGEDVKERPADSAAIREAQTPIGKLIRGPIAHIELARILRGMSKPTIAAVNGYAVGQGLSMALACDIRICSEDAQFGAIWVHRGIPPESAGAYLLTQLVGPATACEMVFSGRMVAAQEAKEVGLVNRVVAAAALGEATAELAGAIAAGAPVAIGVAKMMIYQALETSLSVHGRLDFLGQEYCFNTEDREEGIRSFLEKRAPRFRGR
jgi:2-(1,2-epoxy-1,2-dihydrophenyl)acetyl-CoA isomerase